MAGSFNVNIPEIISRAFGITGISTATPANNFFSPYGGSIETFNINEGNATSYLGTPIYMPVSFEKVRWLTVDDDGKKVWKKLPGIDLPPSTIIDFSQAKKIVRTEIAGRDGTVKEYIGMDDWSVRIRGVAVNEENVYEAPENMIRTLNEYKAAPVKFGIINDMCTWLGVYDVVVENIDFPALEGFPGVQPFTIDCISDFAFEVKYKNGL